LVQSGRKAVSKFKLLETQFERTVSDKMAYKTHLGGENYSLKHIFGILIKFPTNKLKKHYKIWYSQGEKRCQSLNC